MNFFVYSESNEARDISSGVVPYDYSRPFNFLIHGWHDGFNGEAMDFGLPKPYIDHRLRPELWMEPLAQKWVNYTGDNVVIVDWSDLARGEYFDTVRTKIPRAVTHIVNEMEKYMERGMDITKVSIAGHSLGAHVAGSVGREIKTSHDVQIKAIYGMFVYLYEACHCVIQQN